MAEGLHHARLLHSLVSMDLGSCEAPNILLDNKSLRYAISAPDDDNRQKGGVLYGEASDMGAPQRFTSIPAPTRDANLTLLNETFSEFTPLMGDLGCNNVTIVSQYLCQVPQKKSTGTMLLAIVLADLVFLQAAWKLLNLIAEGMLPKKDPLVNFCEGCSGTLYQELQSGNVSRDVVDKRVSATAISDLYLVRPGWIRSLWQLFFCQNELSKVVLNATLIYCPTGEAVERMRFSIGNDSVFARH
ncbi:hypothetical protein AUP68_10197 [Ilyonectria robusta]